MAGYAGQPVEAGAFQVAIEAVVTGIRAARTSFMPAVNYVSGMGTHSSARPSCCEAPCMRLLSSKDVTRSSIRSGVKQATDRP